MFVERIVTPIFYRQERPRDSCCVPISVPISVSVRSISQFDQGAFNSDLVVPTTERCVYKPTEAEPNALPGIEFKKYNLVFFSDMGQRHKPQTVTTS